MKKRLCFILVVLLVGVCEGWGQDKSAQYLKWKAERETLFKSTPDTLKRLCGDTLYLLFDAADTLQRKDETQITWEFHPGKKFVVGYRFYILFEFVGKPRELSDEELWNMPLVTCEELERFHDREGERMAKLREGKKGHILPPWAWESFELEYYFDKIYMVIPTEEGRCLLQEVKRTSPGIA